MPVENVIITEKTVSANRKKLQPVDATLTLIGLTGISADRIKE